MGWTTLRVIVELPVCVTSKTQQYGVRDLADDVHRRINEDRILDTMPLHDRPQVGRLKIREYNRVLSAHKRKSIRRVG